MSLKEKFQAYCAEDEDRLTELSLEEIAKDLGSTDQDSLAQIRSQIKVELTAENLAENSSLGFHALKNIYPYPSSEEVNRAKQLLDPSFIPQVKKKH